MNDIKVGDLVMVVRATWCCKKPLNIGKIGTVKRLKVSDAGTPCKYCGAVHSRRIIAVCGFGYKISTYRLKKIDPPAIPETTETQEESHA